MYICCRGLYISPVPSGSGCSSYVVAPRTLTVVTDALAGVSRHALSVHNSSTPMMAPLLLQLDPIAEPTSAGDLWAHLTAHTHQELESYALVPRGLLVLVALFLPTFFPQSWMPTGSGRPLGCLHVNFPRQGAGLSTRPSGPSY